MNIHFYNVLATIRNGQVPIEGMALVAADAKEAESLFLTIVEQVSEAYPKPSRFSFTNHSGVWTLTVQVESSLSSFEAVIGGMTTGMVDRLRSALTGGTQQFVPVFFGYREPAVSLLQPEHYVYFKRDMVFNGRGLLGTPNKDATADPTSSSLFAESRTSLTLGHPVA